MKIFLPLLLLALLPACSEWQSFHETSSATQINPDSGQLEPTETDAYGIKTTIYTSEDNPAKIVPRKDY